MRRARKTLLTCLGYVQFVGFLIVFEVHHRAEALSRQVFKMTQIQSTAPKIKIQREGQKAPSQHRFNQPCRVNNRAGVCDDRANAFQVDASHRFA